MCEMSWPTTCLSGARLLFRELLEDGGLPGVVKAFTKAMAERFTLCRGAKDQDTGFLFILLHLLQDAEEPHDGRIQYKIYESLAVLTQRFESDSLRHLKTTRLRRRRPRALASPHTISLSSPRGSAEWQSPPVRMSLRGGSSGTHVTSSHSSLVVLSGRPLLFSHLSHGIP